MGLVIAVLAATALTIAAVGYTQLAALSARLQHMIDVTAQASELCTSVRMDLLSSVRTERAAIISSKDDESKHFADQSVQANASVNQNRLALAALVGPADRPALDEFNHR